ncbi:rhomboid family intramembrane serine protease [Candidatus Woesearchaeota archaeon]|nr:MAG: rhomboid family intramembrane serine protease [Candidatus Woesearchaeota archaeon]
MDKDKIAIVASAVFIITASVIVFFAVGNGLERLSYSAEKLMSGEVHRLFTFEFTHVTKAHLWENMVALALVALFALELELKGWKFFACFMAGSLVVALLESPLFPWIMMAGASVGIAALLGLLSIEGRRYIDEYILIPVLLVPIIVKYASDVANGRAGDLANAELAFHFSGFVSGLAFFGISKKFKRKKRILQQRVEE